MIFYVSLMFETYQTVYYTTYNKIDLLDPIGLPKTHLKAYHTALVSHKTLRMIVFC